MKSLFILIGLLGLLSVCMIASGEILSVHSEDDIIYVGTMNEYNITCLELNSSIDYELDWTYNGVNFTGEGITIKNATEYRHYMDVFCSDKFKDEANSSQFQARLTWDGGEKLKYLDVFDYRYRTPVSYSIVLDNTSLSEFSVGITTNRFLKSCFVDVESVRHEMHDSKFISGVTDYHWILNLSEMKDDERSFYVNITVYPVYSISGYNTIELSHYEENDHYAGGSCCRGFHTGGGGKRHAHQGVACQAGYVLPT